MTVDDRIGHLAHIAPVGRHLRGGLDVRGGLAGYDGEAIWCEDCAGAGKGRANGEGAEAMGRGLIEAAGVGGSRHVPTVPLKGGTWPRELCGRIRKE